MSKNVSQGKGISLDGVDDELFKIGRHKNCSAESYCQTCKKKIGILKSALDPEYWKTRQAKEHLNGRLVCLNKKYPKLPTIQDYRPIVVLSPIYKFIEGYIMNSLRSHARAGISLDQYGFIPGVSIEECKEAVLRELDKRESKG
jgi:hypothetical protein